jgi:hypothetical protein
MTHEDGVVDAEVLRGSAPVPVDGDVCDTNPDGD